MPDPCEQHEDLFNSLKRTIEAGDFSALDQNIANNTDGKETLADALAICCEGGHHEGVQHLLAKRGADPNKPSTRLPKYKGKTPLILAVQSCEEAPLPDPIPSPDSVNGSLGNHVLPKPITTEPQNDSNPRKPNSVADTIEVLHLLFVSGASLTTRDSENKTVLSHITHHDVARVLLKGRDAKSVRCAMGAKDNEGYDALLSTLGRVGTSSIAMQLIDYGADTRAVDGHGRTTLMTAVWRNHIEVVRHLLQDKEIIRKCDDRKRNIWHHIACDHEQLWDKEMIELLLNSTKDEDADVNAKDLLGRNYLHYHAIWGKDDMTNPLWCAGRLSSDLVNDVDQHRQKTPLHFAAQFGKVNLVEWLLTQPAPADVRAQTKHKSTPLHLACGYGADTSTIVEKLLKRLSAADVVAQTDNKLTPLHIAAYHGQIATVGLLLQKKPDQDINAVCEGGWTPLHLACAARPTYPTIKDTTKLANSAKYLEVVNTLLSHAADVNHKSQASRTALHLAAGSGHLDIVRLLLRRDDIRVSERDRQGNTAVLDAARSEAPHKMVPLFAPWKQESIKSLSNEVKAATELFDADIIDVGKDTGELRRYRLSLYKLLYHEHGDPGSVTRDHVSTKPPQPDTFRWIHLPSNNLSWCHTLLIKQFIENGCSDVEGFKALEETLSKQQYQGQKPHALHMRPFCQRLPKRSEDHVSFQKGRPSPHAAHAAPDQDARRTGAYQSDEHGDLANVHATDHAPGSDVGSHPKRSDTFGSLERHDPSADPSTVAVLKSFVGADSRGLYIHTAESESNRDGSVDAPVTVQRLVQPSKRALERGANTQLQESSFKACLFMPYLDLETRSGVSDLRAQRTTDKKSKTRDPPTKRDEYLHQAYRAWDTEGFLLHTRRTLDQFWYKSIDTGFRDDDQVVGRYQRGHPHPDKTEVDILMVDQLWIWVLGPELIVTSFPQKWKQPREETPALLSSVLEDLSSSGNSVHSVRELANCVIGHCLSACDSAAERTGELSVFKMFDCTVGFVKECEVELFREFKKRSKAASDQVLENKREASKSRKALKSPEGIKKLNEIVDSLLDIYDETALLEEVKDIRDELSILAEVMNDQEAVLREMPKAFGSSGSESKAFANDPGAAASWIEQDDRLHQHKAEIGGMSQQAEGVYRSITDLLDHKQKHANVLEARYARNLAQDSAKQADSTAKAGRILMMFTIVTVTFLPMSFLAAFFAINIKQLPHNQDGDQEMSLSFALRYILGVGLGTAVAFLPIAWYIPHKDTWTLLRDKLKVLFGTDDGNKDQDGAQDDAARRDSGPQSTLRAWRGSRLNDEENGAGAGRETNR